MLFGKKFPSFLFVAADDKISQDFLGSNLQMIKKKKKKERKEISSLSPKFSFIRKLKQVPKCE